MQEPLITVVGWTGGDVDLTYTRGGHAVAEFRVASTPRSMRQGEWVDRPTVWYTVKCWRALAENAAASLRQGQPVVVHGKLRQESWEAADGRRREKQFIEADSVGHDLTFGLTQFRRSESRPRTDHGARDERPTEREDESPAA